MESYENEGDSKEDKEFEDEDLFSSKKGQRKIENE